MKYRKTGFSRIAMTFLWDNTILYFAALAQNKSSKRPVLIADLSVLRKKDKTV